MGNTCGTLNGKVPNVDAERRKRNSSSVRRAGPTRPGKADDGNHLDVSVERGVSASSVDVGTLAAMNPPEPPSRDAVQMAGSGQALTWQALQPLGAKVGHHNRHGGAGDAAAPAPMTGQAEQPGSNQGGTSFGALGTARRASSNGSCDSNGTGESMTAWKKRREGSFRGTHSLSKNDIAAQDETTSRLVSNPSGSHHLAPSGPISFEALYAKLLVYCHDVNLPPSTEGLLSFIQQSGIMLTDRRIAHSMKRIRECVQQGGSLSLHTFTDIIRPNLRFMLKLLNEQLVVPDFETFSNDIYALAKLTAPDETGEKAQYIPPLRDAEPDRWGVAVCTTDGQMFLEGHTDDYFSIQSSSKPLTYAMALKECGEEKVHSYVGVEPSGKPFNAIVCLPDNRPHNCCVNVGAIMTAAVLAAKHPGKNAEQLVHHVMKTFKALCGNIDEVRFGQETFEAEKSTAANNYALAWFIKARRGLPPGVDVNLAADFYHSCCSIEANCRIMSVVAATLANGGVCPLTNEEVFSAEVVSRVLSQMQACGMYDASGQFLYEIGLPAKSGVSGVVITVVPNVMGIATFSPRLDTFGNSVRGVKFAKMLVNCFSLHVYDNLSAMHSGCKKDPRLSQSTAVEMELANLRFAIQHGDFAALEFQQLLLETMAATTVADGKVTEEEVNTLAVAYEDVMHAPASQDTVRQLLRNAADGLQVLSKGAEAAVARFKSQLEHSSSINKAKGAVLAKFRQKGSDTASAAGSTTDSPRVSEPDSAKRPRTMDIVAKLEKLCPDLDDIQREIILEAVFAVATSDGVMVEQEVEVLGRVAAALNVPPAVVELKLFEWREMLSAANLAPVDLPRGPAGMQRCSLSATVLMQEEAREGAVDAAQVEAVEEALQVELHRPKSLSRQRTERSRRGRRVVSSPELALHGGAGSSDSLAAGRHSGDPSARPSIDETAPVDM